MFKYIYRSKNRSYYSKFIFVIITTIINSILAISLGFLFMIYLDRITGANEYTFSTLILLGLAYVLAQFVINILHIKAVNNEMKCLRGELTSDVIDSIYSQNLSSLALSNNESKDINLLTNELSSLFENYYAIILRILSVAVSFVLAFYYITKLNIYYLFPFIVTIFTMIIMIKITKKIVNSKWLKAMESLQQVIRKIKNYSKNVILIKSFSYYRNINQNFRSSYDKYNTDYTSFSYTNSFIEKTNDLLGSILFIAIYIVSIYLSISGSITAGEVVFVIQISNLIMAPLFMLGWFSNSLNSTIGIREKVSNLLENDLGRKEYSEIQKIDLLNISYKYDDKYVLKNINLSIDKNDIVFLTGDSGAGKSTLIKILSHEIIDFEGKIQINNEKVSYDYDSNYLSKVRLMTQNPTYFEDSIKNNIIMNNEYDSNKLNDIIKKLQLNNLIEKSSNGIETVLDSEKMNVSTGELQRISLARLLYSDYEILLLDEPFAALDERNQKIIEKVLLSLTEVTIVIVSHKLSKEFRSMCTKVVQL